jgi:photosystem II stability/assembly factor-like uncharacterized protein
MSVKTFIATTGKKLVRADCNTSGEWEVENLLQEKQVNCLVLDPHNPDKVYAGTQGSGILVSDDRGKTWRACGMQGKVIKSIAVSPHDPRCLYAGTNPAYLYLSQDGGKSWRESPGFRKIPFRWWWFSPAEKPWSAYVQAIAVSPTDPEVILAGIELGAVVRSQDGGVTWSGHRRGALRDCHNLKFHASNGDWAYEAGGSGGGASFSRDGGLSWRKLKDGLAKNYGVSCAADPLKPEVWYVSVAPSPAKAYGEQPEAYLYRTRGGSDWEPIGWEAAPMTGMPISLVTDPQKSGALYAGLTNGDVWSSPDYGDSWEKLPFNLQAIWRQMLVL